MPPGIDDLTGFGDSHLPGITHLGDHAVFHHQGTVGYHTVPRIDREKGGIANRETGHGTLLL